MRAPSGPSALARARRTPAGQGLDQAAGFLYQIRDLHRQAVVEGIAMNLGVDDSPTLALMDNLQLPIQSGLDIARLWQPPLRQIGDAEPVLLQRRQCAALEGVVQTLQALLEARGSSTSRSEPVSTSQPVQRSA